MEPQNIDEDEFQTWYAAYEKYIEKLWDIYKRKIVNSYHVGHEATFDDFVDFVYTHSNKFISPYL